MASTKYKHKITVDGRDFTRATDRDYTHAVVAEPTITAQKEIDAWTRSSYRDGLNWDHHHDIATGKVVPTTPFNPNYPRPCQPEELLRVTDEHAIVASSDFLAANPDREEYVRGMLASRIDSIRRAEAAGRYAPQVVSWHEGLANARKGHQKALKHALRAWVVPVDSAVVIGPRGASMTP